MVPIAQRILGSQFGEWAGMWALEAMGGEAARRVRGLVLFTHVLLYTGTKWSCHKHSVILYPLMHLFCSPNACGLS